MKTKRLFMIGAVSALSFLGNAQVVSHSHDWTSYRGDDGYESGEDVVVSSDGYNYTTGVFEETVSFHPTDPTSTVISNGIRDVYICKRDANGAFQWVFALGGSSAESVAAIDIDSESNIYITGMFYGTVDFDPSPSLSTLTQTGGFLPDIYVAKYDENGNFIWAKQIDCTYSSAVKDLTVDGQNDVHIVGSFAGVIDVNPDPSVYKGIASNGGGYWDTDGFGVTLNQNGIYQKFTTLKGSAGEASINSVAVDQNYNQYFTGELEGTNFVYGNSTPFSSTGTGADAFVMCLDASNSLMWMKTMETSRESAGVSIHLDASNNVYTTGNFRGTIDLNPGVGNNFHVKSTFRSHLYVSKLDMNGNYAYGKSISGSGSLSTMGNVYAEGLTVSPGGTVYATGFFTKTVDFNPGFGVHNITAGGAEDAFIVGLNAFGNFWSINLIESQYATTRVRNNAIDLSSSGDLYTTGRFTEFVDFNPSGYAFYGISLGGYDQFTRKLERVQPPINPFFKSGIAANNTETFTVDVYPNPTANFINLNVTGERNVQVSIHGISGELVYFEELAAGLSSISLNDLSTGTYIVKVNNGETTKQVKVVKQ